MAYKPIPNSTKLKRSRGVSLQGRVADQDSSVGTRFECATCLISYYMPNGVRAKCPLCDLEARYEEIQQAMTFLMQDLERSENINRRMSESVDGVHAVQGALSLLDDNDRDWLKTILYQWKIDRSVQVRVTHKASAKKRKLRASGFIVQFRGGHEPQAHDCSSMGGMAIAEYFEERLRTGGHDQAMNMLLKGFAELLPGAIK